MTASTMDTRRPATTRASRAVKAAGLGVVKAGSYVWLLAALIALWQWHGTRNPSLFIPPPSDIVVRFREVWFSGPATRLFMSEEFTLHAGASLSRWLKGYLLAAVIGIGLGAVLARHRRLNWMAQPATRLAQSTPSIMLIPLAIVLLGINDRMTISVIVYASLWPVLVNTIDGVSNVDASTINSARAVGIRGPRLYGQVLLRAASPQILAGLRVALGVSIILMVGSELYASSDGIGFYILLAQRTLRYTDMFAGILLAALVGVLANGLFQLIERRILRWVPRAAED